MNSTQYEHQIQAHTSVLSVLNLKPQDQVKMAQLPGVLDYIHDLHTEIERLSSVKVRSVQAKVKSSKQYAIAQVCGSSKQIIAIYKNCKEAADGLGVSKESIFRALDKPKLRCKGYLLKRLEDYKICNQCGFEGKASEHFHVANRGKHGITYKSKCKKCIKENNK